MINSQFNHKGTISMLYVKADQFGSRKRVDLAPVFPDEMN